MIMIGYVIEYQPFDSNSRVHLNHILFGRLLYRNQRGRKYSYYVQGMLDKTPFIRLMGSKIFVRTIDDINLEELRIFGDMLVTEEDREIDPSSMKTGEDHWKSMAREKGLQFRVRKLNNG